MCHRFYLTLQNKCHLLGGSNTSENMDPLSKRNHLYFSFVRMGRRNLCFFVIRISVVLDKTPLNIYHVHLESILGFIPVPHVVR